MQRRFFHAVGALAVAALAGFPLAGPAAPSGLAWDSVSKLVQKANASSLQPGSFDADYAAAASVKTASEAAGGGFFGKIHQIEAMGRNVGELMQKGFAEKHYVAGSKERTDQVAMQTATIRDCAARTITTLDLRKKTYRIVSMDTSGSPSSGGASAPQPRPTDDGTRVAVDVNNTALGAREVAGQQTNGYRSDTKITETKPSGESQTSRADVVGYYTSYSQPTLSCKGFGMTRSSGMSSTAVGQGMGMMAGFTRLLDALSSAGFDKRFTLKQSGPALPVGKLSMFDAVTLTGQGGQGSQATFLSERGNVRSIDANDSAFSVPSDFTKEQ